MFDICILDDEREDAQTTKKMVERYFSRRELEINRIDVYQDAFMLLKAQKRYDLLFLDIEVGSENGIQVAKQMREYAPDMIIVVITSYVQYSIEGYKIQAARYLLKPVPETLLASELDEVLADGDVVGYLLVDDGKKQCRIKRAEVYYIESYDRKVRVHTKQGCFLDKHAIRYWSEQLSSSFIEPFKGILVHVKWISSIEKDSLTIENHQQLPLARRRVEAVKEAWYRYQENSL